MLQSFKSTQETLRGDNAVLSWFTVTSKGIKDTQANYINDFSIVFPLTVELPLSLITCVYVGVFLHVGFLVEPLAAVLAGVGSRAAMDQQMGGQGGRTFERLPALTTFKMAVPGARVQLAVSAERQRVDERLATQIAGDIIALTEATVVFSLDSVTMAHTSRLIAHLGRRMPEIVRVMLRIACVGNAGVWNLDRGANWVQTLVDECADRRERFPVNLTSWIFPVDEAAAWDFRNQPVSGCCIPRSEISRCVGCLHVFDHVI